MNKVIVFDCNETLLDIEVLETTFTRIFGAPSAMRLWFANLILYSNALTLANCYVPFTEIGAAALKMLAAAGGIEITARDTAELAEQFSSLRAHPEVPAALAKLRDAGFRLFTLTDTPNETNRRQLQGAGIIDFFERRFSVDDGAKRHKPAPEAYMDVSKALGVNASDLCMVACHVWDTLGATAAGWRSALVLRKGNAPLAVGPQPLYIGADLAVIADQLIAAAA